MNSIKLTLLILHILIKTTLFASDGFQIKGKISGDSDGKKVYLYAGMDIIFSENSPRIKLIDSTTILNQMFEFSGVLETPEILTMKIADNSNTLGQPVIPVFIHNESITIEADLENIPPDQINVIYDYSKLKISGSPLHMQYEDYVKEKSLWLKKKSEVSEDYSKYLLSKNPILKQLYPAAKPISEGIKAIDKMDEVAVRQKESIKNLILKNSDNYIGIFVFNDNKDLFTIDEIEKLCGGFNHEMKNSKYGIKILQEINTIKNSAVGADYTDFVLNDANGNIVKLSDHLGKGKYVLLEFWASWCGPCRADIPHLKEVYELYNPHGFEIISISMDDSNVKWKDAMEQEKMPWLQLSDLKGFKGEINDIYNFQGIPACILVSPEGKIVTRRMRGSWMDKKLIELYGNHFGDKY